MGFTLALERTNLVSPHLEVGWEVGREPCLRSPSCLRNLSFQSFCQFLMLLRVGTKEGGLFCLKHTETFPSLSRSRSQCQEKYKKIYIRK